jgi:hypothetical protein
MFHLGMFSPGELGSPALAVRRVVLDFQLWFSHHRFSFWAFFPLFS